MTLPRKDAITPYKTYPSMLPVNAIKKSYASHFQHTIFRVKKPKKTDKLESRRNHKTWICKAQGDLERAKNEVIAQELLRLMMPHHPKTRCWQNDRKETFVLSEEIDQFIDFSVYLDTYDTEQLSHRIYAARGDLAEILVMGLFLCERDMRDANIGFNREGRIVKIDGEFCFDRIYSPRDVPFFSAEDLKALPNLVNYLPTNWFNYVVRSERYNRDPIFGLIDPEESVFQTQLHIAIYKIALLPDGVIEGLVSHYSEDDQSRVAYIAFLKKQRDNLFVAACEIGAFRDFLFSAKARTTLTEFKTQILQFEGMSHCKLFAEVSMADEKQELHSIFIEKLIQMNLFHQLSQYAENIFAVPEKPRRFARYRLGALYDIVLAKEPLFYLFRQIYVLRPYYFDQNINEFNKIFSIVVERDLREFLNGFIECLSLYGHLSQHQKIVLARDPLLIKRMSIEKKKALLEDLYTNSDFDSIENREITFTLAKELFREASTIPDLRMQLEALENLEREHPFLTSPVNTGCSTMSFYKWRGKTVSQDWVELMKAGKHRMLELVVQQPNDVIDHKDIYDFLNIPTRSWAHFFSLETRQAKQFKENHVKDERLISRLAHS